VTATVIHGDCIAEMRAMADASVDAIVTDPPYLISFMGSAWDSADGIAGKPEVWREALRVLKPGGYIIAFSSSRTWHRMAVAIEDAGFITHPMVGWITGQGFPKATRLKVPGTDHLRYGLQALKPALEPIYMGQKPMVGTGTQNWLAHGCGALNIDGCRVPSEGGRHRDGEASQNRRYTERGASDFAALPGPRGGDPAGRWPANVITDGSPEVLDAFAAFAPKGSNPARYFASLGDVETRVSLDDASLSSFANAILLECQKKYASIARSGSGLPSQSAVSVLTHAVMRASTGAITLSDCRGLGEIVTESSMTLLCESVIITILSIAKSALPEPLPEKPFLSGNRARVAVATTPTGTTRITISHWKSDGSVDPVICSITPTKPGLSGAPFDTATRVHYAAKASKSERASSTHPTVKPLSLMKYLCRLVCPPGGTVLDMFCGTGTTLLAARLEGFHAIGIEQDAAYVADARKRLGLTFELEAAD
jgi:DNA modification methylase